ncbi:3-hydroxybutyryl-CoA dehydrogenase [Pandoraea terrae]|uniref:L-gulonate 3-dehydrogenase n=1 Tax=Pandoraea terrae TaxID=1537710 RepID=A0A5E4ZD67_9BURK|nr:3-hydroxyacyl-CoA dehydrogenase family protein [Pandoraea terrae]VVE58133.1 3-hydroxybutyryl-CoA dehydrogenase [Pandoraea terrae]
MQARSDTPAQATRGDQRIAILGAGLMGVGIAARFARAGYGVTVFDVDGQRLQDLPAHVRAIFAELIDAGLVQPGQEAGTLARIATTTVMADLAGATFAIEAIPERLSLKHETYAALEDIVAADAIIASNTSGFLPDVLAQNLRHPARFLITHFWNPPHAIPLVEIVPGTATSPDAVAASDRLLAAVGARPVVLEKAIPGFVGNRLQFAVLREALNIVRLGAASPEVVDTVMKASLGRRWNMIGPLEAADMGGLDTFLDVATHLMPTLATDQDVLDLLREHVTRGETGVRSGQGFYTWTEQRQAEIRARRAQQLSLRGKDDA